MKLISLMVVSVMIGLLVVIIDRASKEYDYSQYIKSVCAETDFYYFAGTMASKVYDCSNLLIKENK